METLYFFGEINDVFFLLFLGETPEWREKSRYGWQRPLPLLAMISPQKTEKKRGKREQKRMGSFFPAIFLWPLWEKTGREEKSLYSENEGGGISECWALWLQPTNLRRWYSEGMKYGRANSLFSAADLPPPPPPPRVMNLMVQTRKRERSNRRLRGFRSAVKTRRGGEKLLWQFLFSSHNISSSSSSS